GDRKSVRGGAGRQDLRGRPQGGFLRPHAHPSAGPARILPRALPRHGLRRLRRLERARLRGICISQPENQLMANRRVFKPSFFKRALGWGLILTFGAMALALAIWLAPRLATE